MALQVRVGVLRRQERVVGQPLHRLQHPGAGLAAGVEVVDGGAVGGGFLGPPVGEQAALADLHGASGDAGSGGTEPAAAAGETAGDRRADADQGADENGRLGALDRVAQPGKVTMGEVGGLMGENADHLVRRV